MDSRRILPGSRRLLVAIALGLLSMPATSAAPASAAGGTTCTFEQDVVASPGLTTSPSSGTITTNGETGTISCDGPVNGKDPTGDEHLKNTFTFDFGALKAGALISGTFTGDRMSGTFEAQPMDGDCASGPVTKFHVSAKGTLH